ncbi:MAG: type IV pilin protein [Woeseiaceae bacterium]
MRSKMQGVTLAELLIVMVIISILTAIAYPSYRQYIAKAKRNEAMAALLKIATLQERWYLQNNTYTMNMNNLGFNGANNVPSNTGTYIIRMVSADANTFVADANYQPGDVESTKCDVFTINGAGIKGSSPATDCWTNTRR